MTFCQVGQGEVDHVETRLAAGDQVRFPGEAVVTVALDAPARALNVMTRRGRCQADVVLRKVGGKPLGVPSTSVRLDDRVADLFLKCTEGVE